MGGTFKQRALQLLTGAAVVATLVLPGVAGAAPKDNELVTKHAVKTLQNANDNSPGVVRGNGKPTGGSRTRSNGIDYHGGGVMLGTTDVYLIWYGNWPATSTTPAILTNLVSSEGGSPYFNINTTYYNGAGQHVTNAVAYKGSAADAYSQGTSLSDAGVQAVVANALATSALPADPHGVYFVLTSSDVNETSGFLTQYCGWHTSSTIGSTDVKYAFVGDPSRNLTACAIQTAKSPNGNVAADAMASIIAHELEESVTDPDLNAWYDNRGMENADKCAWTFGTTYKTSNGSLANMRLGGRDYMIQRNWLNANGGSCQLKY